MQNDRKGVLLMHLATFLFGFTAIFGKLITLSEFNLVWFRMLIASIVFLMMPKFIKKLKAFPKKELKIFGLIGILVALHWICFYGCIKVSDSASLALACFGITATFTAVIEPLVLRNRFKKTDILLGALVLVGLFFIAKANPDESFSWQSGYVKGIGLGILAAFLASLFSVLNKKYIADHDSTVASMAQMAGGFLFLSALLPLYIHFNGNFTFTPSTINIVYLVALAILCTNIAFSLEMMSLKRISAFLSTLIINLEPIYGILMAVVIFNEHKALNVWFFIGALVILSSVGLQPLIQKWKMKRQLA